MIPLDIVIRYSRKPGVFVDSPLISESKYDFQENLSTRKATSVLVSQIYFSIMGKRKQHHEYHLQIYLNLEKCTKKAVLIYCPSIYWVNDWIMDTSCT